MPTPSPPRSPSPPEDIAAAMGFSSFGAKPNPPKKKRKLADPNSEGSGSNNTPLGTRSRKLGGELQEMRGEAPRGQGQILRLAGLRDGGQQKRSGYSETQDGLPKPDALAAEALDETAGLLLEMGQLPQYLDWSGGVVGGGPHDGLNWQEQGKVAGQGLADPDPLAAEALDETAGLLLETGRLPRYLDWSEGGVGDGVQGDRGWQGGGVGGGGEEMRRQGKRADGEWDWHALRNGVVVDERGDVGFYDGSFVEDPWRGLGGKSGEGR